MENKFPRIFFFDEASLNSSSGQDAIQMWVDSVHSPLEQFSIIPLIPMKIGDLYFSFTNPSLFMLLTLSLVLLFVHFVTKKGGGNSVPNAWQSLVELIYDFVPNLVNEQIGGLSGNVKQKFFPCISVTFTFSLFRNLQGMIPYSFTVTSHFLITLGLSFSLFIGITIVAFQQNGLHFLSFSLPAGVPLPLAPFLVLLELIPHSFRALSLGIRLFANMMAGHSSVKILSGSAWTMLCMNDLLYFIGDPGPLFIVLALTGLELGVAISQAHVSTISICIYLNDATNLHQSASFFIIEQKLGIILEKAIYPLDAFLINRKGGGVHSGFYYATEVHIDPDYADPLLVGVDTSQIVLDRLGMLNALLRLFQEDLYGYCIFADYTSQIQQQLDGTPPFLLPIKLTHLVEEQIVHWKRITCEQELITISQTDRFRFLDQAEFFKALRSYPGLIKGTPEEMMPLLEEIKKKGSHSKLFQDVLAIYTYNRRIRN